MRIILLITGVILIIHFNSAAQCNPAFTASINQATVQVQAPAINGLNHTWSFGDGNYGSGTSSSHTYLSTGAYVIKHVVYDSIGTCTDSTTQNITINFQVTCQASFTAIRDSLVNGRFYFASTSVANEGVINNYYWTINGSYVSNAASFNHLLQQGTDTVCLFISSTTGCTSNTCQTVIGSFPPCNSIGYVGRPSWPDTKTISFTPTPLSAGIKYSWNFGDGTTSTQATPVHSFPMTGIYNVGLSIVDTINQCVRSTSGTVQIGVSPCDTAFHNIVAIVNPLNPWQYSFHCLTDSLRNIRWSIIKTPDSLFNFNYISHDSIPMVTFTDTGYYLVCLTATAKYGCPVSICKLLHVSGVDSLSTNTRNITVYPNPATSSTQFTIQLEKPDRINIVLYNANGISVSKIIKMGIKGINIITVPLQNLNRGQYFIEINTGNTKKRGIILKL
jgi:PKD repeat protein